jgi:uncharacterized membrane protein YkoI
MFLRSVGLAVLLLAGPWATAQDLHAQRAETLQDAVQRVQQETGGKILSAHTVRSGKSKVYRIKVLTPDGRVRVVQVQATER